MWAGLAGQEGELKVFAMVLHESLLRVFKHCQTIATRRPGVICTKGQEVVHVSVPATALWIKVEVEQAIGGLSQIRVTEYRVHGFTTHQTCCSWEVITLIEQILSV